MTNNAHVLDTLDLLWALALHHKSILERRFPNYKYTTFDPAVAELKVFLRVDTLDKSDPLPPERERLHRDARDVQTDTYRVLLAVFSPSSICIVPADICGGGDDKVYYADPKFTDDILSDKIKEWEAKRDD